MTSIQQREQLQSQIWKIANEVRGAVDGWDFKQFVLGTLFYRFISENFTDYIEGGDDSIDYASLPDSVITPEIKDDAVKTKGYFIYPSQLFGNVVKTANTNPNLNTDLKAIFDSIESSANGYASEKNIKGLFADFDTTSTRLGNTVENKNSRLAAVLKGVEGLNFGNFEEHEIDLFGDAYEFLINNYAANAGKSGGEFFTPQNVSKLISQLAMHKQATVNKIYDPAAGSGSLLLQAKKQFEDRIIEDGFFGQEINHTTYNLARMNMFLHNIISLPSNLFYGTSIAVNILVLSKHKPDTKIQFIDASGESFFTKETNNNVLENKHIDRIIDFFDKKEDVDYIAKSVDYKSITENDYNLSVSSYIEVKDTRPKTDIKELNERIRRIVERENELRIEIDKIVAELEEDEL